MEEGRFLDSPVRSGRPSPGPSPSKAPPTVAAVPPSAWTTKPVLSPHRSRQYPPVLLQWDVPYVVADTAICGVSNGAQLAIAGPISSTRRQGVRNHLGEDRLVQTNESDLPHPRGSGDPRLRNRRSEPFSQSVCPLSSRGFRDLDKEAAVCGPPHTTPTSPSWFSSQGRGVRSSSLFQHDGYRRRAR